MYIGKTLAEVAEETKHTFFNRHYIVKTLQDEEDYIGRYLDLNYSVEAIIKEHPEIANYRVKFENNLFDPLVLRVIKE